MKIITLTTEFYLREIDFLLKSLENDENNKNIIVGGVGISSEKINELKEKYCFIEFNDITNLAKLCGITDDEIKLSKFKKANNIIKIKPFFVRGIMNMYDDDVFLVDTDIIFKYSIHKTYTDIFSKNYDFFVPITKNNHRRCMYMAGLMYFKNIEITKLMVSKYCEKIIIDPGIKNWYFDQTSLYDTIDEMKNLKIYDFFKNVFCDHSLNINKIMNDDIYFIARRTKNKKEELLIIIENKFQN
jgi:hypothetical protein